MKEFFTVDDCDKSEYFESHHNGDYHYEYFISLNRANALLQERGRVVYGFMDEGGAHYFGDNSERDMDTHTALLINIEPIERDSAADMLELAKRYFDVRPTKMQSEGFIEHARRLLGRGRE